MQLDPQLLQLVLGKLSPDGGAFVHDGYGYFPEVQGATYASPESGGYSDPGTMYGFSRVPMDQAKSARQIEQFGLDGALQSTRADTYTNPLADLAKFAAMAYGVNALGGALTGVGGGGLLGGADAASELAGGSGVDALGAAGGMDGATKAALFGPTGYGPGMTGLQTSAFDGVLGATGSTGLANVASQVAGLPAGTSSVVDVVKAAGNAAPWTNLLGAALGAAGSRDQQQTSSRDPWGPAQPFLQSLLGQGQMLQHQYQQQPFSQQQQTAYNNLGGLLNAVNGGVPALLQGMGANASGANNYDRANPRRQLAGSNFNLGGFSPGLLSFFPQGGR